MQIQSGEHRHSGSRAIPIKTGDFRTVQVIDLEVLADGTKITQMKPDQRVTRRAADGRYGLIKPGVIRPGRISWMGGRKLMSGERKRTLQIAFRQFRQQEREFPLRSTGTLGLDTSRTTKYSPDGEQHQDLLRNS